jgi:glyoxalase family protein
VDIQGAAADARRGAWGVGSVHHLAWRVEDEAHQLDVRQQVDDAGRRPTPVIDRFWFQSVYFLEPGGVLFELATDGPGFSVDEDPAHLGESLVLPPWLEPQRAAIQSGLPPLRSPIVELTVD